MEAGGKSFKMIPCLNTDPLWVNAIAGWINDFDINPSTNINVGKKISV